MNALPKLVIKDRCIYLDGVRLRCVKTYTHTVHMDRGTTPDELTVTMLVDSRDVDTRSINQRQTDVVNAFADAVHNYNPNLDNRKAWASTFGIHHDMPPEPRTINSKPPSPDGITFGE